MKKYFLLFAIILSSFSNLSAQNLQAEMKLFTSWFEGRFDNFAQVYDEKENKAEYTHERIHSIFAKANLPEIGENGFFVQQYTDGDEAKIYRQRLYLFTPDKREKALKLTIYSFDDEKKYRDAHLDASKLTGLKMSNLKTTAGCEVYWKLNEAKDKFAGYMKPNACKIQSQRLGKTIVITDDLFLTKDEIWINDQAKDEQGNYVFGNKSGVHSKLKKVRWFEGWTAVLKSGETPLTDKDFSANDYDGNVKLLLHDQGGKVKLNEKYSVQLAQLRYKSGVWVLTLSVLDNASGRKIAYAWANPEAEKIGINLRWVQAGFNLKKQ